VVISSNPSLVRIPDEWQFPWNEIAQPCSTFRISAAASIASLDLYTSGLGHSLLTETASKDCKGTKNWRDRITLTRDSPVAPIDRLIAIKVDSAPISTPGASMQGGVIALEGAKKVAEFTLKVERSPRDESWTAITWVLSVLIPSIITFLIGQGVIKLGAQQKEKADFREYRLTNMTAINEFLTKVDRVIRSPQERPGQTVYALILENNIFSKMPRHGALTLSEACVADDLNSVVQTMKSLFPEFKESIAQMEESLRKPK
jgi:hypothetical protein